MANINIKISIRCNEKWDDFFIDPNLSREEFQQQLQNSYSKGIGMQITLSDGRELIVPKGVLENNLMVIKGD